MYNENDNRNHPLTPQPWIVHAAPSFCPLRQCYAVYVKAKKKEKRTLKKRTENNSDPPFEVTQSML
jgi:hypothetical protein